jgi:endonuclease/exonuclease/phosphatase family metal-dependent hydrolase
MKIFRKKTLTLLAIALVLIAGCFWARWRPAKKFEFNERKDGTLRMVTWNVGYFALVKNKNMRNTDLREVTDILKKASADVIVLQELSDLKQPDYIADKLGPDWAAYSCKTGHGSQVVSVLTRLAVLGKEEVVCGGRKAIGLSLIGPEGNTLYILGIHAPHPARGLKENVESIRYALSQADSKDEAISIVAGDFNYNFDAQSMGDYYSEILEDFGDSTASIGETYYAHTRIDHMFHKPSNLKVLTKESGIVDLGIRFANVPGFRDHRPIVVTYNLG